MFLSMLHIILLSQSSYAYDITQLITIDTKYEAATKTAVQAAYKQSGYESKANVVKDAGTAKGMKWIKDNNLSTIVAIGTAITPVLIYKKIEVHTGNFILSGSLDKKEAIWTFGF